MARSKKSLENLRMFDSNQSREQAKVNGRKGGKASGKARREKAELKKLFMQFANMRPTEKESEQLLAMGFADEELSNMTSYVVSLFKNGAKGNPKAMEIGVSLMTEDNKRELENQRLQEELNILKLEQEKLKRDLNMGSESFENLTPLAELLKIDKKEDE